MLVDERYYIHNLAYLRIVAARHENEKSSGTQIRQFLVPPLNFKAADYTDMINWNETDRSEPPVTRHISLEDLKEFVEKPRSDRNSLEFEKYPCHTQGTERCVRLVTEASKSVCGVVQRHGFILAKLKSRSKMKTFNTKSEFNAA